MILYHGSDNYINKLKVGSYLTPSVEFASTYGQYVYVFDVSVDRQVFERLEGYPLPIKHMLRTPRFQAGDES